MVLWLHQYSDFQKINIHENHCELHNHMWCQCKFTKVEDRW